MALQVAVDAAAPVRGSRALSVECQLSKRDVEAVQVLLAAGGDLGHELLRRLAGLLGRDHDRRAMRVVGADEVHLCCPACAGCRTQMSAWMYSMMWPMWNLPLAYGRAVVTKSLRWGAWGAFQGEPGHFRLCTAAYTACAGIYSQTIRPPWQSPRISCSQRPRGRHRSQHRQGFRQHQGVEEPPGRRRRRLVRRRTGLSGQEPDPGAAQGADRRGQGACRACEQRLASTSPPRSSPMRCSAACSCCPTSRTSSPSPRARAAWARAPPPSTWRWRWPPRARRSACSTPTSTAPASR